MAITIKGIRVTSLSIEKNEEGDEHIACNYQLISSVDKVLAKQSMNSKPGYGTSTFTPSPQTIRALSDAVQMYKKDVEVSLGLDAA